MPEPLNLDYLRQAQRIIAVVPPGPWPVEAAEDGRLPDQVGPICFLETWSDQERVPVVEFISFAREALPRFVGEASRQNDRIRELEQRVRELERAEGGVRDGR